MKSVKIGLIAALFPGHLAMADAGQPGFECHTVKGGPGGGATATYIKSRGGTSIGEAAPNAATCEKMVNESRSDLICSVAAAGSFAVFGIAGTLIASKLFKSLDDCLKSLIGIAENRVASGGYTGSAPADPNPGSPGAK